MAVEIAEHLVPKVKHPLCVYEGDINSADYMQKVFDIVTENGVLQDDLTVDVDAVAYERRRIYGYRSADSLYDAYLLSYFRPRRQFNYPGFVERHPSWEEIGMKK